MTLLLASVGLAAPSAAAAWWLSMEERPKARRGNLSGATLHHFGAGEQRPPRNSTILAVLSAFVVAGLVFASIHERILGLLWFSESSHPAVARSSTAGADDPRSAPSRPRAETDHTLPDLRKPEDLAAWTGLRTPAANLFGDQPIGISDPIQDLPPALDLAITFALPGSSFSDTPAPGRKVRNAATASRLARITVYWPDEGDFYTRQRKSSTGVRLRDGHCAVDPKVIPYGSVVHVPGIGRLVAVDTGSAVVSRRAARQAGRTPEQKRAIVIDVFCSTRSKAHALIKQIKHFSVVSWQRPERISKL